MTQQLSITQYSAYKAGGMIDSISLSSVDHATITVNSKQDTVAGVAQPDLVTTWDISDINNQITYLNSQIANFQLILTDANANIV